MQTIVPPTITKQKKEMSNIFWKSFNICISKFKCLPTITFSPPISENQDQLFPPTIKPSPIFKNFNSLYNFDFNCSDTTCSTSKSLTFSTATAATTTADDDDDFLSEDDSDTDLVPDFSSAFASRRFFFTSPGSSNSIVEPPVEPPVAPEDTSGVVVGGGVAVKMYSPDPYTDFRKSMQEMIETRELKGVEGDWEFLHELLLCYLTLNPKHAHKFIIGAFADVVVSIVWPPPAGAWRNKHLLGVETRSHV